MSLLMTKAESLEDTLEQKFKEAGLSEEKIEVNLRGEAEEGYLFRLRRQQDIGRAGLSYTVDLAYRHDMHPQVVVVCSATWRKILADKKFAVHQLTEQEAEQPMDIFSWYDQDKTKKLVPDDEAIIEPNIYDDESLKTALDKVEFHPEVNDGQD